MRHLTLAAVILSAVIASPDTSAQDENLAFKIHKAIATGVEWLKAKQTPEGHFGDSSKNPTYTGAGTAYHGKPRNCAFALFTLLKCEVPTTDPVIVKGFTWLRQQEFKGTYENSAVCMAFREYYYRKLVEAMEKKYKRSKDKDLKVKKAMKDKDAKHGLRYDRNKDADWALVGKCLGNLTNWQFNEQGWRYGDLQGDAGDQDVSATHLALFGIKACMALGHRVDPKIFYNAANYLLNEQDANGQAVKAGAKAGGEGSWSPMAGDRARGWPYMKTASKPAEQRVTGSMTGAGICGLMVCKGVLLNNKRYWKAIGKRVDTGIHHGVAWLNQNWVKGLEHNPDGFRGTGYYWWVVERVGILGGLTMIGTHNWYLEGAQHLVTIQKKVDEKKGYWDIGQEVFPADEFNTCYALLFLKKHAHSVGIPPITGGNR